MKHVHSIQLYRHWNDINKVVLMSLLLFLNIFHTFSWEYFLSFTCWIWAYICFLGFNWNKKETLAKNWLWYINYWCISGYLTYLASLDTQSKQNCKFNVNFCLIFKKGLRKWTLKIVQYDAFNLFAWISLKWKRNIVKNWLCYTNHWCISGYF